jgi:tetratricopeptide (TPR) repeat protein
VSVVLTRNRFSHTGLGEMSGGRRAGTEKLFVLLVLDVEKIVCERVRLGHLYAYTAELKRAEASLREGVEYTEPLMQRFPSDAILAGELAALYSGLSANRRLAGDYTQALSLSQKSLALLQGFLAIHPDDESLRHGVAIAYASLAVAEGRMGKPKSALERHRQSVSILERLAAADPGRLQWQRDLMFGYSHIGDLLGNPNLTNLGDTAGAVEAYRKMANTAKRLHEADPADLRAKSDYGIALMRTAAVVPASQSAEKIALLRKSLHLAQQAVHANPENTSGKMDIALCHNFLGEAFEGAGQTENAVREFRNGLRTAEPLLHAGNATLLTADVLMSRKLAVYAAKAGDAEAALRYARHAVEITQPESSVMKDRPANVRDSLAPRASAAMGLANAELARKRPRYAPDARRWLEKSLEQFQRIENLPTYSNTSRREREAVAKALRELR